jgi:hypothetical protein
MIHHVTPPQGGRLRWAPPRAALRKCEDEDICLGGWPAGDAGKPLSVMNFAHIRRERR